VRLGAELAPARYADAHGRPKLVRYWEMTVVDDGAEADEEVDELAWLEPAAAAERCSYSHDRELVAAWAGRGTEVERKFLVGELPAGIEDAPRRRIAQGYLVTGDVEVRLRRSDKRTLLTIKAGSGLARAEEEIEIEAERFDRLWPLTEGRRVEKVRHLLSDGGRTIELDRFSGAREGLVLAEVEFPGRAEAEAWTPPGWLGQEVTGDPAYANARLAS
jgi:CYTH domain-containing protein